MILLIISFVCLFKNEANDLLMTWYQYGMARYLRKNDKFDNLIVTSTFKSPLVVRIQVDFSLSLQYTCRVLLYFDEYVWPPIDLDERRSNKKKTPSFIWQIWAKTVRYRTSFFFMSILQDNLTLDGYQRYTL